MKNLVFNLRTAKAQAGCAKLKDTSLSFRRGLGRGFLFTFLLLTLGVGQMWGYVNGSAYIYFNPDGKWSYTKYYFAAIQEHGSWQTKVYELSKISHTNLYYLSTTEWNDADYITFGAQNGNFSGGYWGYDSFKSYITMCGEKCNWGLDYTKTYTFKPSANTKGTSINPSYHSGGYSDLNHDQTVYKYTSNGGTSAASYTAQSVASGTVTISAYKMTGNGTASNSSNSGTISAASTTYLSKKAAYTGEVTLTASPNANYIFEGWYESTSATTPLSTDLEYTYNAPNSTKSVYARFRYEQTYTITIANNKTAATTTQQVGATTPITITAPSVTDHVFSTWEAMPANVTKYSGNLTDESIQIRATAAATVTADFNLIPCSIVYKFGSGQSNEIFNRGGSSVTTAAMTYDITSNAYYKDVTVSGTQLNFRFYYNGSKEYATSWNGDYPNIYSVTINGDQRDCNTEVQGWTNKSSIKVTYASGTTSLRVWYSKQTGKAWVTETTYSVSVASENTNRGTVNKSSVTAGRNTASASFTATPVSNSGWMFKQWSATSPASLVSSATTNPNTVKATSTGGSVQAQFKHRYILRGSIDADGNPAGGMAGWDATDNSAYASATISDGVMTITANLTKAKTKYKFKIYDLSGSSWKGQTVTTDIPDNTARTLSGSNNVTLTTTAAGTYTFVYTVSSNSIKVLFPSPVYSVTYGVQSGTGTVTAKIGTESIGASPGKAVGGANVVMTASDGTGYQFSKWVNESGTQISTSNPYTISSIAANCTIKAVFTARNYTAANNLKEADGTANGQYNVTYDNTSIAHTSAPSRTGYTVEGYYKQAAWTNKIANTNLSLVASTDYATSASKWKVTSAPDLYIKWQQTLTLAGNGVGSTNGSVTTTYLGTASSHTAATRTGYTLNGYYDNTSGGNKILTNTGALVTYSASVSSYINSAGKWIYNGTPTLSAQWTAEIYTITFAPNGGTVTPTSRSVTYDAAITNAPVPEKTGYNFTGYNTSGGASITTNTGVFKASVDGFTDGSAHWVKASGATITAQWSPKTYTITLTQSSETGYGSSGTASVTATYDAALPTIASLPTAAQGYAFMGYYTGHNGTGTQYYGPTGNKLVATYTTAGGIELFAYFKKAEITDITLDNYMFDPVAAGGTGFVIANPTIAPTPMLPVKICWELLYDNGNSVPAGHEAIDDHDGSHPNRVKFSIAGLAAGRYKIKATLRTGDDCSGGTLLSEREVSFTIASGYTVTIQYKDTEGNTIAPSTTSPGKATDWTAVSAPTIVGYNFSTWVPGDGITLESSATTNSNRFKATFNGTLTAQYTKKGIIYFKNTLGWSDVYVNFMSGDYWNTSKGSGNGNSYHSRNNRMTLMPGTTDVYYFEYSGTTTAYVSFTSASQTADNFWAEGGVNVVFPTRPDASNTDRASEGFGYNAGTPMFVPLSGQSGVEKNNINGGKAYYFNKGYWVDYNPISHNTGYTLEIYNHANADGSREVLKTVKFYENGDGALEATVDLDAATTYAVKFLRDNNMRYTNVGGTNLTDGTSLKFEFKADNWAARTLVSTAAGSYVFKIRCNSDGYLYVTATYPAAAKDFQILYNDNAEWSLGSAHSATWIHPSRIIRARENGVDTISFFVAKDNTPILKARKVSSIDAGTGAITWESLNINEAETQSLSVDSSAVYNFKVTQGATAGDIASIEYIGPYTGNYYIRCNALNSNWDNYTTDGDHRMTYSSFSESNANSFGEKYSHYKAKWCPRNTNIAFCIANDYSPCITDTLKQDVGNPYNNTDTEGTLKNDGDAGHSGNNAYLDRYSANVRFMWDRKTNKISRAYISAATSGLAQFLVLRAGQELHNENNVAISSSPANSVLLSDNENWIYEARLMIKPGTRFKLYACYAKNPVDPASAQYFRGAYDSDNFTSDANSVILIGGESVDYQLARIVYDFKTNRLIAAWMPSGEVSGTNEINADIMVIRDHQESARCITFTDASANLSKVKTVYGVMRFNRWILNNRQHPEDQTKEHARPDHIAEDLRDHHAPLPVGQQKSTYERRLYFISFPFDVLVGDIFGFGTYGQYWVIQYYDGLNRAKKGYWMDSKPNWKYVSPTEVAQGYKLEKNQGYILELNLSAMAADNTTFWSNGISTIELYFPSTVNQDILKQTDITIPALSDEYECTINRGTAEGDRRVKDSYWRCIGVPSYNLYNSTLKDGSGNDIRWKTDYTWQEDESEFPFIYMWNKTDNTLTPQSTSAFLFQPMHAYLTQIKSAIVWTAVSAKPSSIVARRARKEATKEYNWRIELKQDTTFLDQTYVRMTDLEQVTDNFDFGQDLIKELNSRSNIYTFIGYEKVAANSMTLHTDQTTVIPVGANITTEGDYTFALPDGADGIGVTLIDEETGTRTNLSAGMDYTVYLEKGTHDNRFWLEISPVQQTPTDIELINGENGDASLNGVRKVLIDGILYIVKDGKLFDARGARLR